MKGRGKRKVNRAKKDKMDLRRRKERLGKEKWSRNGINR